MAMVVKSAGLSVIFNLVAIAVILLLYGTFREAQGMSLDFIMMELHKAHT